MEKNEIRDIEYTIKTFERFSLEYEGSGVFWRVTYPGSPGFLKIRQLSDGFWNITVYIGNEKNYENKDDYKTSILIFSIINEFLKFSNKNKNDIKKNRNNIKDIPDKFKLAWMFDKTENVENLKKLNNIGFFD